MGNFVRILPSRWFGSWFFQLRAQNKHEQCSCGELKAKFFRPSLLGERRIVSPSQWVSTRYSERPLFWNSGTSIALHPNHDLSSFRNSRLNQPVFISFWILFSFSFRSWWQIFVIAFWNFPGMTVSVGSPYTYWYIVRTMLLRFFDRAFTQLCSQSFVLTTFCTAVPSNLVDHSFGRCLGEFCDRVEGSSRFPQHCRFS